MREIDLAVEELRHAFMHRLETTPDGACLMVTLTHTLILTLALTLILTLTPSKPQPGA